MGQFQPPSGWPIVRPGLLMAHIGPVMVVYQDPRLDDANNDIHTLELARAIDARADQNTQIGVLYDLPTYGSVEAKRQKQLVSMLESRREILKRTTVGFALSTTSMAARGVLRAMFWVAPPPYPYTIVTSPGEGFRYLAGRLPGLDADALDRGYTALLETHRITREGSTGA